MTWRTKVQCLLAFAVTYILAAESLWPVGLLMGLLPALVVGLATKRLVEQTAAIDRVIEDLVRRGGGDTF